MATPNRPASQNKYTEQNMGNTSFDEDFGVNAVEIIGYDSINNVLRRIAVNENGETKQTTLETLIDTLQELVQRLSPLAGAMNNTAQLRTVVTGAVTATGPITSAQEVAALLTQTTSLINSLRPPLDNNLAIQSNINNAVGV